MSWLRKIGLMVFFLGLVYANIQTPSASHAASYTAVQSGNWDNMATWGGGVPSDIDNVTIPAGITVTVPAGITVGRAGTTHLSGTLHNYSTTGYGFLIYGGNTPFNINAGGSFQNHAILTIDGDSLDSAQLNNNGTFVNASTGTFIATDADISNGLLSTAIFDNYGTITLQSLNLSNRANGTIHNYGPITNNLTIVNEGIVHNYALITNNATIENYNFFYHYCAGAVTGNPITINPAQNIPTAVAPALNLPAHRTHTTDTTPSFSWGSVSNAESYRLMVYLEDRSFQYKKRTFNTSYTLPVAEALVHGNKYLWRVRTQDSTCSTWSSWSGRNTLFVD